MKVIRWSFLRLLTLGVLVESAWTVYLGVELPRIYVANHWDIAWVGLDIAQVVMLSAAAWTAWRGSTWLVIFATASATLLVIDAWFDVTTARRGDQWQSIVLASLVEVPSALVLVWVAHRGLRHAVMTSSRSAELTLQPATFDVKPRRD